MYSIVYTFFFFFLVTVYKVKLQQFNDFNKTLQGVCKLFKKHRNICNLCSKYWHTVTIMIRISTQKPSMPFIERIQWFMSGFCADTNAESNSWLKHIYSICFSSIRDRLKLILEHCIDRWFMLFRAVKEVSNHVEQSFRGKDHLLQNQNKPIFNTNNPLGWTALLIHSSTQTTHLVELDS